MQPMQRSGADRHDQGLPLWVLPICLLLAGLACAVVLSFTMRVMGEAPAPATPSPSVATSR